jgi:hypothetical protein
LEIRDASDLLSRNLRRFALSIRSQRTYATRFHCRYIFFIAALGTGFILFLRVGTMLQRAIASHGCVDAVSITTNTHWTTNQCHGDVTVTNGATLNVDGGVTAQLSSLTLGDGVTNGFLTVNADTGNNRGPEFEVDGNVEVKSGSTINGNNNGFGPNAGPGKPTGGTAGGSYGGQGGGTNSNGTYGSVSEPTNLGSGGPTSGGFGGGAIHISLGGNFTNNGTISMNGQTGGANGGGSGGSVWIELTGSGTWSGSGNITATGGGANTSVGAGGGGRISITGYSSNAGTNVPTALGGSSSQFFHGQAGTVFTRDTSQTNGKLFIYNNGLDNTAGKYTDTGTDALTVDILSISWNGYLRIRSGDSLTVAPSGTVDNGTGGTSSLLNEGSLVLPDAMTQPWNNFIQRGTMNSPNTSLTIPSPRVFTADSPLTLGTLTLNSNSFVTHTANTTTETYKINITATNISNSGTIDANGVGYATANGPGFTAGSGCHGGHGFTSCSPYDSTTAPTNIGSGGSGASGGGAVILSLSGNLTNNGTIRANGNGGVSAGSGGTVSITFTGGSSTWAGTGGINANGGAGGATGGGGGGGRVAVVGYVTNTHSGATTAYAGTGGTSNSFGGAPGTVYTKSSSATNGDLVINNNGNTPRADTYAELGSTTTLTLFNNSKRWHFSNQNGRYSYSRFWWHDHNLIWNTFG